MITWVSYTCIALFLVDGPWTPWGESSGRPLPCGFNTRNRKQECDKNCSFVVMEIHRCKTICPGISNTMYLF